jgi:hypothetical protein
LFFWLFYWLIWLWNPNRLKFWLVFFGGFGL